MLEAGIADGSNSVDTRLRSAATNPAEPGEIREVAAVFVTHVHVEDYARRLREGCDRVFAHLRT